MLNKIIWTLGEATWLPPMLETLTYMIMGLIENATGII